MKNFFILTLFCVTFTYGQSKYLTRSGLLTFEASMPAFEEVKAKNETVTAIFNSDNGEIAILALIKGFRFKNALMEEHFNESYIESSQFPKAIFKGKIDNYQPNSIQKNVKLSGSLNLHGVTKPIITQLEIVKSENEIIMKGSFNVLASDYAIEIPKIVRNKVSDVVNILFNFKLNKKSD